MDTNVDSNMREAFADFLLRVSANTFTLIDWQRFAVQHYHDEFLESIRRKTVKLSIDRDGGKEWSESEMAKLTYWAEQLREY